MKQPVVQPLSDTQNEEFQKLIAFFEDPPGFVPTALKRCIIGRRIAYAFIELNKAVMENKGRVTSALKRMILTTVKREGLIRKKKLFCFNICSYSRTAPVKA